MSRHSPGATRIQLAVGLVAIAIVSLMAVRVLSESDWDPTIFTAFGDDANVITTFAEDILGRDVITRATLGHDGKYFFVHANDPWLIDPDRTAGVIDRPLYRTQRMLYPVLAGGGGLFSGEVVVWALLVVNVVAIGVGSWAVAELAMDMGGSSWWGLAFVLNIGFISEVMIDGAGVVAAAFAFWAVVLMRRGRALPAIAFLALAALAREAMLLAAAGTAVWLWMDGRKGLAVRTVSYPAVAVVGWAAYTRFRIGVDTGVSQVQEIGLPFGGVLDAVESWMGDPVDLAAGVAILGLLAFYSRRVLKSRELVGWAFLGFVPLALLFTRQVWESYFDISRAIAPTVTSFVLLLFLTEQLDATNKSVTAAS